MATDTENTAPPTNAYRCVREDLADRMLMQWLWDDKKTGAKYDATLWNMLTDSAYPSGSFIAVQKKMPPEKNIDASSGIQNAYQLLVQPYREPKEGAE